MKHRVKGVQERRDLALANCDLKFSETGKAVQFEGYASVWDRVDSYGDTVIKGAFANSIKARNPMMFFGHNPGRIPGKWISLTEDSKGLRVRGELTPGHSEAIDAAASLKHGSLSGLSIGGYTLEADWIEQGGEMVGRKIKTFDLYEISLVSIPAESEARIDGQSIKSALDECETFADMEDLLREAAGFSKTSATAFVARMRRIVRGEPGDEGNAPVSKLVETLRSLEFPTSLTD